MVKRLYRSRKQRVLAGVCGGIAEYFDIDVTLVRLGLVAAFFLAGTGILFYIIAAIIIPQTPYTAHFDKNAASEGGGSSSFSEENSRSHNNAVLVIGLILIAIGTLNLIQKLNPFGMWYYLRGFGWPVLLMLLGAAIIISSIRRK